MSESVCTYCNEPVDEEAKSVSLEKYSAVICEYHLSEEDYLHNCETCLTSEHVTKRKQAYNPLTGSFYFECSKCENTWA